GTVFRDFDFFFAPDFGGTAAPFIADAYVNYRFRPELQLQAGRFKVPIGMELLQSDRDTYFNERGFPSVLVPSRDMGVKLHGDVFGGVLRYDLGIFNGVGDERSTSNADFDDNKAFVGRVFVLPFKADTNSVVKNLGVGLSGSWEDMGQTNLNGLPATTGGSTAGYTTPALEQFFAYNPVGAAVVAEGTHWRLSPQAYWYYGPLGITTEYVISDQQVLRLGPNSRSASLRHSAWQFSIGYVLTGEDVTFTGVVPRRAFKPLQGQWGAWQVVARYSELDIDDDAFPAFSNPATSARGAQEFALGVNWYLNRNIRLNTSFAHIHFFGAGAPGAQAPAAVSQNDENVLFTRFQLAF
ncbi:MAG TPA: porin, partial [Clostridia bacterium]|nr:porin [Clostridia bacterium]